MADTKHAPHRGYSPDMDERSPRGDLSRASSILSRSATAVVVCWVLALALGGMRHAWLSAIFGVVLSGIAGAIGAFAPASASRRRRRSPSCWRSCSLPTERLRVRRIRHYWRQGRRSPAGPESGGVACGSLFSPKPTRSRPASPRRPRPSRSIIGLGADVAVEAGAGAHAGIPDAEFAAAGADRRPERAGGRSPAPTSSSRCAGPRPDELDGCKARRPRHRHHGPLRPARPPLRRWPTPNVAAFAMEFMPRITRAQVDGRALLAGQPRRLSRRHRRRGRIRPRLADDDDRGRHRAGGPRLRHGRGRRRPAGDRHRPPPRRRRHRDRRAPGRQGAGRNRSAPSSSPSRTRSSSRPRPPPATPRRCRRSIRPSRPRSSPSTSPSRTSSSPRR